jgi:PKD repeat protein
MKQLIVIVLALVLLTACQNNTPPVGGAGPVAMFSASPQQGQAPLTVTFDAAASTGAIASYDWTFGDGQAATGVRVTHTFTQAGTFTVRLTVTNAQGATALTSRDIVVSAPGDPSDPQNPTDPGPGDPANPDPENPDPEDRELALIAAGVSVPSEKAAIEQRTGSLALEAVVTATQATGGTELTLTGTLTQAEDGTVSYSAEPSDRLRVVLNNGATLEYFISNLNGDFDAPSVEEFLRRPHVLGYRVVTSNGTDITISLVRQGNTSAGAYQNSMQGALVSNGITYTVELVTQGDFTSSVGSALDYRAESTVQGTITSPGFSATVNERTTFRYFQFENAVEINTRTIDNRWTVGSDSYVLADGFIRQDFFNGRPSEFNEWRAQGTLTRNGVQVGGIGAEFGELSIDIFLQVDNQREILYRHLRN